EPVTLGHEALDSNPWKLSKPVQIFKGSGEPFETATHKLAQAQLDPGRLAQRLPHRTVRAQLRRHSIGALILPNQRIYLFISRRFAALYQVPHAVSVDRIAELHFRGDFVPLRHGNLPHIVTKTAELRPLPIMPRRRSPAPRAELLLHPRILPVTD